MIQYPFRKTNHRLVQGNAGRPFMPGSGFRHIIIKAGHPVVKSIVPPALRYREIRRRGGQIANLSTFCSAQAWKGKKLGEKIGFFPPI
jgi:hypothetical protein